MHRQATIRDATPADADAIADAHVASWRAGYAHVLPASILEDDDFDRSRRDQWHAWRPVPGQHVLVAGLDGRLIGFCSCGPERERDGERLDRGEVYAFYLHPSAWGSGAAAALMDTAVARLAGDGHRAATLWVLADNPRGRAFYEKAGWRPTGRSVDFDAYCAVVVPEVEYVRDLGDFT